MTYKLRFLCAAAIAMLGGTAVTMLSAATSTSTPKGYLIAEITVTDPVLFKQYSNASTTVMTKFGGRYLVRGGQTVAEEGSPPSERTVVIEFENLAAARAFYESADYKAVAVMRAKSAQSRVFLVEGASPL